jgi:hypothetical protein
VLGKEKNLEVAIDMLASFSEALNEHVDCALAFVKFGAEHITEYRQKFFPEEQIYKFRTVDTVLEELMPDDNYILEYRDKINKCTNLNRS